MEEGWGRLFYRNRRESAVVILMQLCYSCLRVSPWTGIFIFWRKEMLCFVPKLQKPEGNRVKRDLDDFPCATFPVSKQDLIQMLRFCVGGSKVWEICVHVGKSLTFLAAKTKTVAAPPTVLRNPEQVSAEPGRIIPLQIGWATKQI